MTPVTPFFAVMGTCAFLVLGACEQIAGSASLALTGTTQTRAKHELGREVYNFRCYYCHGYSGDARTLAANLLKPAPRNFKASTVEELPHERVVDAITNGRTGTAMKGFAGTLTPGEISALANFVIEEFVRNKAHNTRYHTDANGWRDHERFSAAFPFATHRARSLWTSLFRFALVELSATTGQTAIHEYLCYLPRSREN